MSSAFVLFAVFSAWAKFGRATFPARYLVMIPLYVVWKIPLYLSFAFRGNEPQLPDRRKQRDRENHAKRAEQFGSPARLIEADAGLQLRQALVADRPHQQHGAHARECGRHDAQEQHSNARFARATQHERGYRKKKQRACDPQGGISAR